MALPLLSSIGHYLTKEHASEAHWTRGSTFSARFWEMCLQSALQSQRKDFHALMHEVRETCASTYPPYLALKGLLDRTSPIPKVPTLLRKQLLWLRTVLSTLSARIGLTRDSGPPNLGSAEGGLPDLFRFVPISPFSSYLFRFACGNTPICSDLLRFLPVCSEVFQNKSEQIRKPLSADPFCKTPRDIQL